MDSTDTAKAAAKLTARLKAFVNETNVPRCLIVKDIGLESSRSIAIIQSHLSGFIKQHSEFVASVTPGFNQSMRQWTISIRSAEGAPTLGTMFNSPTSSATSGRVQARKPNKSNTPKVEE